MSLQPFNKSLERLLQKTEYLVDGKFLLEMKDLSLSFRGSSNQRIINLKESLKKNKLIIQNII
jgi:anaerobic ribonucleoside-triphosphate reductase activating protein